MKNTNRKSLALLAVVLIACMCICMATKEGLEKEDPCKWIIMKGEKNTRNCDDCPQGKTMTRLEKRVGKGGLEIVEFTCGKAA